MPQQAHLFLGRAGQLAVMAELLVRGLNVAVPEVDLGDDVFVVRSDEETVTRVQVKTATASTLRDSYSAHFNLSMKQLKAPDRPRLIYAFVVRLEATWTDFIVISRSTLARIVKKGLSAIEPERDDLVVRMTFTQGDVRCKGTSLQSYRNVWDPWPHR